MIKAFISIYVSRYIVWCFLEVSVKRTGQTLTIPDANMRTRTLLNFIPAIEGDKLNGCNLEYYISRLWLLFLRFGVTFACTCSYTGFTDCSPFAKDTCWYQIEIK